MADSGTDSFNKKISHIFSSREVPDSFQLRHAGFVQMKQAHQLSVVLNTVIGILGHHFPENIINGKKGQIFILPIHPDRCHGLLPWVRWRIRSISSFRLFPRFQNVWLYSLPGRGELRPFQPGK